jgi:hypothetical protein
MVRSSYRAGEYFLENVLKKRRLAEAAAAGAGVTRGGATQVAAVG